MDMVAMWQEWHQLKQKGMQRKNYSNPYTLNIKGKGNKYTNFPENVSERANNRDIYKKAQKTG